jgi:hypothetical protein
MREICTAVSKITFLNPLNAELNPICHFLALLGARPILHVSMVRVNVVMLRPSAGQMRI